jgi:hypothetical protein
MTRDADDEAMERMAERAVRGQQQQQTAETRAAHRGLCWGRGADTRLEDRRRRQRECRTKRKTPASTTGAMMRLVRPAGQDRRHLSHGCHANPAPRASLFQPACSTPSPRRSWMALFSACW